MRPEKDDNAVVDLLDVLLDDGAVIEADVLITVADVPLVGIKLRAAIAGLTTMREYGMFRDWDEAVRDRTSDPKVAHRGLKRTGERASRERRHDPSSKIDTDNSQKHR